MSINNFCIHQGVIYNKLNKWFRKTHKSVVLVQIEELHNSCANLDYLDHVKLVNKFEGLC